MQIKYYVKSVYGKDTVYLADSEQASYIQALTGCKTVTLTHMKALESLGFQLVQSDRPLISLR